MNPLTLSLVSYGPITYTETMPLFVAGVVMSFLMCLLSFKRRGSVSRAVLTLFFSLSAYRILTTVFLPLLLDKGIPYPNIPYSSTEALKNTLSFSFSGLISIFKYQNLNQYICYFVWFFLFAFLGGLLFKKTFRSPWKAILIFVVIFGAYVAFNAVQNYILGELLEAASSYNIILMISGYVIGLILACVLAKIFPRVDFALGNNRGKAVTAENE